MKKLFIALTFLVTGNTFSQGLNNEQYQVDSKDSEIINSYFLGIDVYKFYVNAKLSDDLDVIFEEYNGGELTKKTFVVKKMVEAFGMNPIAKKYGDDFIRVYIRRDIKDSNSIEIYTKYLNLGIPNKFEGLELLTAQTRAFDSVPAYIELKTPIVAIYGNKEGDFISCPGDAEPVDIIKLYDWVCIVYLDKLDK